MTDKNHNVKHRQEQIFVSKLYEIMEKEAEISSLKDEIKGLKSDAKAFGIDAKDFAIAQDLLKDNGAKARKDIESLLDNASRLNMAIGREVDMFDGDPATAEQRAYYEGLQTGKLRRQNKCPYTDQNLVQEWQRGFNEGTEFVNESLAAEVAEHEAREAEEAALAAEAEELAREEAEKEAADNEVNAEDDDDDDDLTEDKKEEILDEKDQAGEAEIDADDQAGQEDDLEIPESLRREPGNESSAEKTSEEAGEEAASEDGGPDTEEEAAAEALRKAHSSPEGVKPPEDDGDTIVIGG